MNRSVSDDEPSERQGNRGMKLQALLAGAEIGKISGPADVEIQSVAYDSRKVMPGGHFLRAARRKTRRRQVCRGRAAARSGRGRKRRRQPD